MLPLARLRRHRPNPPAVGRPARLLPVIQDRAFLPAALEILETPPSPVRLSMITIICGFVTAALLWAWLGRIDIHATARGKVEPLGHAKVIQPLEAGRIAQIAVSEGQAVHAGDILVRLDSREAEAELAAATHAHTAALAEALRREAAIAALNTGPPSHVPVIAWPSEVPAATRAREEAVLRGDLAELNASLVNLNAQERERIAAIEQLNLSLAAERAMLPALKERVQMRETLLAERNGSRLTLIDAVHSLQQVQAQIAAETGRLAQAQAALTTLQTERRKAVETFVADNRRRQAEARRTADERGQDQARAAARLDRMALRAPVAGNVYALSATTQAQVVTTGQELMRLVPADTPLDIVAYVTNDDIGFVSPGQSAAVKLDSFPFTRFGMIEAEVVQVARDAIAADTANQALIDATRKTDRIMGMTPTARPMTDLVFEARLRPRVSQVSVNGQAVPLTPGMTVTVEIRTGSRRIIDYLFSPVMEVISTSLHER